MNKVSRLIRTALTILLLASSRVYADSGVLIPRDHQQPDPAILSLEEMSVAITIDNGDARVFITQIFANHTNHVEEGSYVFALPPGSTVSDFATWDGPVRIPAVILERKRAEELYENARLQTIDPGLLEAGERDGSDPKASSVFSAKIVPIPAYGTKRLELEYHQTLPPPASSRPSFCQCSPPPTRSSPQSTFCYVSNSTPQPPCRISSSSAGPCP